MSSIKYAPMQRHMCHGGVRRRGLPIDLMVIASHALRMQDSAGEVGPRRGWRGPTVAQIAAAAGLGTATVDRVLNGRDGVRAATRERVVRALRGLSEPAPAGQPAGHRIVFICESGASFNRTLEEQLTHRAAAHPSLRCQFVGMSTATVEPVRFAQLLERVAADADALVVVAREDLTINRALRAVTARGVPVVCLTTDLPTSGRIAYVGSDQVSAGSTAAYLLGRLVGAQPGKILIVVSAPYRGQEEREIGFRRVLRAEFGHLEVVDRVNSNDDPGWSHRNLRTYIEENGPPAGVYNVAGGNLGIARALAESGLAGKTVFIGHELNANSRMLLECGQMDVVIGHDVAAEIETALDYVGAVLQRRPPPTVVPSGVRVYTKYNCV